MERFIIANLKRMFGNNEEKEHQKWIEYQNTHERPFTCGIDMKDCIEDCNNQQYWINYGCIYLKGYKNY